MNCQNCRSPGDTCIQAFASFMLPVSHILYMCKESPVNLMKTSCVMIPLSLAVGRISKEILSKLNMESTLRKCAVMIITPLISIPLGCVIAVQLGIASFLSTGVAVSAIALALLLTSTMVFSAFNALERSPLFLLGHKA